MPDRTRLLVPLSIVLALASVAGTELSIATTRGWAEHDADARARLALKAVRAELSTAWRAHDRAGLGRLLGELAKDETLVAAAACAPDRTLVAATPEYPVALGCAPAGADTRIHSESIVDAGEPLGFVVVLQDQRFFDARASRMRGVALASLAALALGATLVTVVAGRALWRRWSRQLRLARPDGGPDDALDEASPWTADRLKQTLRRHLRGEKIIVVANREPYIHEREGDGTIRVVHPASGLVTALEPVMRACSGVWVAHGSGSADRETVDRNQRVWVPPVEKSYQLRRVWLTHDEESGYYYGFANEGLWPLCHVAHARPSFRGEDWTSYQRVNERFAAAACAEANGDDPIILVQDYHFALAPQMIRKRLPRATILSFWHIPWPNAERFGICPWQEQLLRGLLGASILGFHTQFHCNNFLDTAERFLEARVDRERFSVQLDGHSTLVRPYPISIEWPNRWLADCPPADECRRAVLAELGLRADAFLGLGVDRLDYTKGIEERLLTVEKLLESHPHLRGRFTFLQLAAPSRTVIERYRELDGSVEALTARINARFGRGSYRPIVVHKAHHEQPAVQRYYRAADLCYVSSLHDGMNLVAKEFVAARDDERGVLVLSTFAGASRELTEALLVNPYDIDGSAAAMATALTMTPAEQAARMRAMRSLVRHYNVFRWAGRMLVDAARLRQRERLSEHLSEPRLLEEQAG